MTTEERIAYWQGPRGLRRVEDMTREELLEALAWCVGEIRRLQVQAERDADWLFDAAPLPESSYAARD